MTCEVTTRRTEAVPDPDGMTPRPGHILSVFPYATPRSERALEQLYILTIVDAEVDQVDALLMQTILSEDDFQDFKRAYRIDLDSLPEGVRGQLSLTGRAEVTLEMLRQAARHALTGEPW